MKSAAGHRRGPFASLPRIVERESASHFMVAPLPAALDESSSRRPPIHAGLPGAALTWLTRELRPP